MSLVSSRREGTTIPLTTVGRDLVRRLAESAGELALRCGWLPPPVAVREVPPPRPPLESLSRLIVAEGVADTLFAEYAAHRDSDRGDEEIGWLALGIRERDEAAILATLPAGTARDAGVAHVRFDSLAQAVGSRMVRQRDRRLVVLGVVHTHPGTLRHPSDGDFRGDVQWVRGLRGRAGVFGIGTADANGEASDDRHRQARGPLCLSWYALGAGDRHYRPLAPEIVPGPDLAAELRPAWSAIEEHAARLDRVARQQTGARCEALPEAAGGGLVLKIPLAGPVEAVWVMVQGKEVQYLLLRDGETLRADLREARVDHGLYVLLAELASQSVG